MTSQTLHSIQYGALSAIVGLAIGLFLYLSSGKGSISIELYVALTAPIASFATSFLIWYYFFEKHLDSSIFIWTIISILNVVLAHHLSFYLMLIPQNICYHIFGGCKGSLNDPPMNLINGLYLVLPMTFFSILIFGIITIPAGIAITFIMRHFIKM